MSLMKKYIHNWDELTEEQKKNAELACFGRKSERLRRKAYIHK